ncbi:MAG: ABC transporter ATP-binding protein [Cyanobacteria bacterium P01_F01_bin.33]
MGLLKRLKRLLSAKVTNPAYRVILSTVSRNRWLVALSFNSNLFSILFEGSTFGIIFGALSVLGSESLPDFRNNRFTAFPPIYALLSNLDRGQLFLGLIGTAVLMQLAKSSLRYVAMVASGYLAAKIQVQMTERVFSQILSLSFPCASRYKVGDLVSYVNDAGNTVKLQISLWNNAIVHLLSIVVYAVVVMAISLPLSGVAVVLAGGVTLAQNYLQPRIRSTSRRLVEKRVDVTKQLAESIQALRVIHTFARQRATVQQVRHIQRQLMPLLQRQARLLNALPFIGDVMAIAAIGGLLVAGFFLLDQSARLVLPALITFIAALNRLSTQVQSLSSVGNRLADNIGGIERLDAILATEGKSFTRRGGLAFTQLRHDIHFDRVGLCYTLDGDSVLQDVSFRMKRGTMTALVGGSGAGKSSLSDLLVGLYDPTAGAIRFDGVELGEFDLDSWRSHLGVVSQDTFVFNRSILDNIRYGCPDATAAEVIQAARAAQAHEFIAELPGGYDTVVGERGYRLSGGQRQRLAIARTILKQPEVLILDEATSALDSQSEALVQQALAELQQDRTVMVIAHRLSTIVKADQILVLEKGRVVERGTHHELLAKGKRYAHYWQLQLQGGALV